MLPWTSFSTAANDKLFHRNTPRGRQYFTFLIQGVRKIHRGLHKVDTISTLALLKHRHILAPRHMIVFRNQVKPVRLHLVDQVVLMTAGLPTLIKPARPLDVSVRA